MPESAFHDARAVDGNVEADAMSTKKAAKATATALFDTADRPEKIRNVALVGHSGAGKTTLVEALLAVTGTIVRAGTVAEGSTVSDHDPVEVSQQRSVGLSVCPLRWDNVVVNLLDTPGYPDFTGELRAGLRAADAALFVVSAADDIDPITVSLWEECAALGTPRAVVVTKLDVARTSLAASVAACQRVFGGRDGQDALPLHLTVDGAGENVPEALAGLLTRTVYDYSAGFPAKESPVDASTAVDGDLESERAALIEAIGLEKPAVFGWSTGGEIGLALAVRHPDRVGSLVVSGATAGGPTAVPASPELNALLSSSDLTDQIKLLDALFTPSGAVARQRYIEGLLAMPAETVSPGITKRQAEAEARFAASTAVYDGLSSVDTPVLVTDGVDDQLVPIANAHLIAERISAAKLVIVPDASHGWMLQDLDRFVATMGAFTIGQPLP